MGRRDDVVERQVIVGAAILALETIAQKYANLANATYVSICGQLANASSTLYLKHYRITRIPGVTGVHSSFVLRRVVDKTALPIKA